MYASKYYVINYVSKYLKGMSLVRKVLSKN